MPKVTWLGDVNDPDCTSCSWGNYHFPVGVPVEVAADWEILPTARLNRYFRVDDDPEPASGRVDYDTFLDQPLQGAKTGVDALVQSTRDEHGRFRKKGDQ